MSCRSTATLVLLLLINRQANLKLSFLVCHQQFLWMDIYMSARIIIVYLWQTRRFPYSKKSTRNKLNNLFGYRWMTTDPGGSVGWKWKVFVEDTFQCVPYFLGCILTHSDTFIMLKDPLHFWRDQWETVSFNWAWQGKLLDRGAEYGGAWEQCSQGILILPGTFREEVKYYFGRFCVWKFFGKEGVTDLVTFSHDFWSKMPEDGVFCQKKKKL